ncbi:MAG: hypothetical protein A3G93_07185 [Nitrospinae bacterium RIFCSPLOWO2_12_FULL_45_22]|nr:MAG: hypothetical protein A3G93_07185 [Nitrospinae bacterium RIFCSPLOWO2_12_FULL_45_22]
MARKIFIVFLIALILSSTLCILRANYSNRQLCDAGPGPCLWAAWKVVVYSCQPYTFFRVETPLFQMVLIWFLTVGILQLLPSGYSQSLDRPPR